MLQELILQEQQRAAVSAFSEFLAYEGRAVPAPAPAPAPRPRVRVEHRHDRRGLTPRTAAAVTKLTDICFAKCVTNPGSKLSSSETSCIQYTAERYLDSSVFVMGRLMKSQGGAGGE